MKTKKNKMPFTVILGLVFGLTSTSIVVAQGTHFQRVHGSPDFEYLGDSDICPWDSTLVFAGRKRNPTNEISWMFSPNGSWPTPVFGYSYSNPNMSTAFNAVDAYEDQIGLTGIVGAGFIGGAGSNIFPPNFLIVETDATGVPFRETYWGAIPNADIANDVMKLSDSGILAVGVTSKANSRHYSTIIKLNSNHNLVWRKHFGGQVNFIDEQANSILENTPNNSLIVAGNSRVFASNQTAVYILELDNATGGSMYEISGFRLFSGEIIKKEIAGGLVGYYVVGQAKNTLNSNTYGFLIEVDASFGYVNHQVYQHSSNNLIFTGAIYDEHNDNVIACGSINLGGGAVSPISISIAGTGLMVNSSNKYGVIGSINSNLFARVHLMSDGNYRFTGRTEDFNYFGSNPDWNIYDVKTKTNLSSGCNESHIVIGTISSNIQSYDPHIKNTQVKGKLTHQLFSEQLYRIESDPICVGYNKTGTTTSVNDFEKVENISFKLSPNPAKDYFKLSYDEAKYPIELVEIYDVTGKLVMKNSLVMPNKEVNIQQLSKGLYTIRIYLKKNSEITTLLLSK